MKTEHHAQLPPAPLIWSEDQKIPEVPMSGAGEKDPGFEGWTMWMTYNEYTWEQAEADER